MLGTAIRITVIIMCSKCNNDDSDYIGINDDR